MNQSDNVVWHPPVVETTRRWAATGGPGMTLWITGLSGSGKSTIGVGVEAALIGRGRVAYMLDGDNLRHGLNGDLGFSEEHRRENMRRVAHVAHLLAGAGVVAIVTLIGPYRRERQLARGLHEESGFSFFEVFVDTPLEVCEQRDPKGLYALARAGEISGLTGLDAPYEAPEDPDLLLDHRRSPEELISKVVALVESVPGD